MAFSSPSKFVNMVLSYHESYYGKTPTKKEQEEEETPRKEKPKQEEEVKEVTKTVNSVVTISKEEDKKNDIEQISKEKTKNEKDIDLIINVISQLQLKPEPDIILNFIDQLSRAQNVIVMVGAGTSVAAGIPDFRTPGTGLYRITTDNNNKKLAKEMWPGGIYKPTIAHYFIKLLHDKNKLLRVFTQNIDSLETMTGLSKEKIVAAHGNFDSARCVFTRKPVPIEEVREAYLNDTLDKLNMKHGTKLVKPDIVFFGEGLPQRFHELTVKDFPKCDLLIVMGTSLQVQPFASLIRYPKRGTPRILINRERVGEDQGFDFITGKSKDFFMKGDCDDCCIRLAKGLGWEYDLQELVRLRD